VIPPIRVSEVSRPLAGRRCINDVGGGEDESRNPENSGAGVEAGKFTND
jgi:hypothetical protein